MRRKVYTKELILNAAYEILVTRGAGHITARNVAIQMGISTQPIYLEFENMQGLKDSLLQSIATNLQETIFTVSKTGDRLVDFGLNYIQFAMEQPRLYTAFYINECMNGPLMYDLSINFFKELTRSDLRFRYFSDCAMEELHDQLLIQISGVGALASGKCLSFSEDKVHGLLKETINRHLEKNTEVTLAQDC
ncbi:TetR/AcrR family transcriptional regulator [Enterococcus asini]|uniref:TetR/AcrR family transcriptional regulator n=1 Tax=Enterococcus asini TaxID=57732 RepID=UPI0022E2C371|nr:TetR/AcrR family transcriptional regulator [Enterococcus asini]